MRSGAGSATTSRTKISTHPPPTIASMYPLDLHSDMYRERGPYIHAFGPPPHSEILSQCIRREVADNCFVFDIVCNPAPVSTEVDRATSTTIIPHTSPSLHFLLRERGPYIHAHDRIAHVSFSGSEGMEYLFPLSMSHVTLACCCRWRNSFLDHFASMPPQFV